MKGLAEAPTSGTGAPPVTEFTKISGSDASSSSKVSSDKNRNYAVVAVVAVVAGVVNLQGALKNRRLAKLVLAHNMELGTDMLVSYSWLGRLTRIEALLPK